MNVVFFGSVVNKNKICSNSIGSCVHFHLVHADRCDWLRCKAENITGFSQSWNGILSQVSSQTWTSRRSHNQGRRDQSTEPHLFAAPLGSPETTQRPTLDRHVRLKDGNGQGHQGLGDFRHLVFVPHFRLRVVLKRHSTALNIFVATRTELFTLSSENKYVYCKVKHCLRLPTNLSTTNRKRNLLFSTVLIF